MKENGHLACGLLFYYIPTTKLPSLWDKVLENNIAKDSEKQPTKK